MEQNVHNTIKKISSYRERVMMALIRISLTAAIAFRLIGLSIAVLDGWSSSLNVT